METLISRSRSNNSKRNLVFGLILRIVSIVLPFVSRTIIIRTLGVEYNGIGSLFSSILTVLSLFELGLGSAIVFGMYKPVAENDVAKVNAYLAFYKRCYLIIGVVVTSIGCILIPFLSFLIKGSYPTNVNIYYLYLLYLANSAISYFFFSYRSSVLSATQRNDIISKISIIVLLIKELSQIVVLLLFKDYLVYTLILPISTLLANYLQFRSAKKMYPSVHPDGNLEKAEIKTITEKIVGLLFQKIGSIVLSSVDTIVISAFLGLTVLGLFNNYHYIISCLIGIFSIIPSAIVPSIGNSIQTESKAKNYKLFKLFHFMYIWSIVFCCSCLLSLYQDFISLWIGDEYLLEFGIVICLTLYFYTYKNTEICYLFREAAGLWSEWKYVALIAAISNLIINIILVRYIGLYGILISTIICKLFIYLPFFAYPLFRVYFQSKKKFYKYIVNQILYMIVAAIICLITYLFCSIIKQRGILFFSFKILICLIVPNLLMVIAFCKTKVFKELIIFLKNNILPQKYFNRKKEKPDD